MFPSKKSGKLPFQLPTPDSNLKKAVEVQKRKTIPFKPTTSPVSAFSIPIQRKVARKPAETSRGVPIGFLCFLAACATIICLFIVYQIFSWKTIYAVVGVILVYFFLSFFVKVYSVKKESGTQETAFRYDYLKNQTVIEGQIQAAKYIGEGKTKELESNVSIAQLQHERDLIKISTSAEIEMQRIKRQPLPLTSDTE